MKDQDNLESNTDKAIKQESEISNMLNFVKDNFKSEQKTDNLISNSSSISNIPELISSVKVQKDIEKSATVTLEVLISSEIYLLIMSKSSIIDDMDKNFNSYIKLDRISLDDHKELYIIKLTGSPNQNSSAVLFLQKLMVSMNK